MWAVRRATNPLRNEGYTVGIVRALSSKLEVLSVVEGKGDIMKLPHPTSRSGVKRGCWNTCFQLKLCSGICSFSTQAGTKSTREEDGCFELGASADAELDLSVEDGDVDEHSENELESSNVESETRKETNMNDSALFEAIINIPPSSFKKILDKWFADGKELDHKEVLFVKYKLRQRRMYFKALQLSDWLLAYEQFDFDERNYASHIDLIARVHGLHVAEDFVKKIPESFKGEIIYRSLLASCVSAKNMKKAEEVLKKMEDLGFPLTTFVCNQLLNLYKVFNKKKIPEILLLMEKEKVRPDHYTYGTLIDIKCKSKDITGMEEIVERMKDDGIAVDNRMKIILARCYTHCGLKEKAEAILKDLEGEDLNKNRWACRFLLPLYAKLKNEDAVRRLWKVCKSHPRQSECLAAIEALGELKKVEEAESVFNEMLKTCNDTRSLHYISLLEVYVKHKMLDQGKALVKQMSQQGCPVGPLTWDCLVKLYVDAGEVEKADSLLQKAVQKSPMKPQYRSYMTVLRGYANKGDIHNAERYFKKMVEASQTVRHWEFDSLLQAYVKARSPAYGFKDRMKAHNVLPDRELLSKLALVDQHGIAAASNVLV